MKFKKRIVSDTVKQVYILIDSVMKTGLVNNRHELKARGVDIHMDSSMTTSKLIVSKAGISLTVWFNIITDGREYSICVGNKVIEVKGALSPVEQWWKLICQEEGFPVAQTNQTKELVILGYAALVSVIAAGVYFIVY